MPSKVSDSERFADLIAAAANDENLALESLRAAVKLAHDRMKGAQKDRSIWRTNWIRSARQLAVLFEQKESSSDALNALLPVVPELDLCDDAVLVMQTRQEMGRYLMIRGELDAAMDLLQGALRAAETLGDTAVASTAMGNIGMVFFHHREYADARHWFTRAMELMQSRGDRGRAALALRSIGMTHSKTNNYNKALSSYKLALKELKKVGDEVIDVRIEIQIQESIGVDNLNLADTSHSSEHYNAALEAFQKCMALADQSGLDVSRAVALRNVGQVFAEPDFGGFDLRKAVTCFEEAREIIEPKSIHTLIYQINRELSLAYESLGDYSEALKAYKRYNASERAVLDLDSASKLRAIEERHKFERSQEELRRERDRTLELEAEARSRTAELSKLTLSIGETNAHLRALSGRLRVQLRSAEAENKELLQSIVKEIDEALGTDVFWGGIEEQLSNLHGESLTYLAKHFPSLTPTERKVCALIRIDLSSKEIARLLNTETRSIEKYRQRIRKKLGLKSIDSLSTFISSL